MFCVKIRTKFGKKLLPWHDQLHLSSAGQHSCSRCITHILPDDSSCSRRRIPSPRLCIVYLIKSKLSLAGCKLFLQFSRAAPAAVTRYGGVLPASDDTEISSDDIMLLKKLLECFLRAVDAWQSTPGGRLERDCRNEDFNYNVDNDDKYIIKMKVLDPCTPLHEVFISSVHFHPCFF